MKEILWKWDVLDGARHHSHIQSASLKFKAVDGTGLNRNGVSSIESLLYIRTAECLATQSDDPSAHIKANCWVVSRPYRDAYPEEGVKPNTID